LSGLTNLRDLNLHTNAITDVSALRRLTSLTELRINGNQITDVSALKVLTSLAGLDLRFNPELSDIQPLLDNPGLGAGDRVELRFTRVSCSDAALLEAKGVMVHNELFSPCP